MKEGPINQDTSVRRQPPRDPSGAPTALGMKSQGPAHSAGPLSEQVTGHRPGVRYSALPLHANTGSPGHRDGPLLPTVTHIHGPGEYGGRRAGARGEMRRGKEGKSGVEGKEEGIDKRTEEMVEEQSRSGLGKEKEGC